MIEFELHQLFHILNSTVDKEVHAGEIKDFKLVRALCGTKREERDIPLRRRSRLDLGLFGSISFDICHFCCAIEMRV